ncbi:L-fuculose-phosphate aldolase [Cereibacter sphaeroides]|uniref:L-fuculose-phosphate aldolase n=1 Tax=Cereibacter sphaeroides TaxID=1063 RepID=UPI001F2B77B5|nr:L-fuculose-phosphate aldolase [Cereibacter sphaeroides]MCE6958983.1 L-fuculose-phosphate aldolase [Cereibacter sphaeroides]MCE6969047.1 L-fuculose-phosphate aldolase [Cereibacter sphaeroides]MCE6973675.1 L-fuculose-phosphate aldolase [Cereibacter sphaeroides]
MQADELAKRKAIIDACLEMNRSGLNQGTSGNISVRHGEGLLITPTAMAYGSLEPEDIVYLAMDGTATGRHRPSSEWRFHRDILAARPEANAVVHAHPLACTTLAILNRPIPAVHYMIAAAGGPTVRVAPYAIYGSEELSQHAVAALEGRFACLLEHHGMIAIGPTLARTMWIAEEVETLAKQYLGCLQLGEVRLLSDEQIAAVVEKFAGYGLRA